MYVTGGAGICRSSARGKAETDRIREGISEGIPPDRAREGRARWCGKEKGVRLRSLKPAEGYGSYRTNTAFMDKVADTYGPVQGSINRRLKKTLDPEWHPDIGKIRYPLTMSASSA